NRRSDGTEKTSTARYCLAKIAKVEKKVLLLLICIEFNSSN
ncbi:16117_t:CDS:2, partial [Gigaspora rosea]